MSEFNIFHNCSPISLLRHRNYKPYNSDEETNILREEGDLIKKINGVNFRQAQLGTFAGKIIKLTVERGGSETEITMTVDSSEVIGYSLSEITNPTARQKKIREGWLKR